MVFLRIGQKDCPLSFQGRGMSPRDSSKLLEKHFVKTLKPSMGLLLALDGIPPNYFKGFLWILRRVCPECLDWISLNYSKRFSLNTSKGPFWITRKDSSGFLEHIPMTSSPKRFFSRKRGFLLIFWRDWSESLDEIPLNYSKLFLKIPQRRSSKSLDGTPFYLLKAYLWISWWGSFVSALKGFLWIPRRHFSQILKGILLNPSERSP